MEGLVTIVILILADVAYSKEFVSISLTSKMIGGEIFDISNNYEYEFLAHLTFESIIQYTAVVISAKHVLTAYHGLKHLTPPYFGKWKVNDKSEILDIRHHNQYKEVGSLFIKDIAVVELKNHFFPIWYVTLGHKRVASFFSDSTTDFQNAYVLASPFRISSEHKLNEIQKMEVKILSSEECKNRLKYEIDETQLCAVALNEREENFLRTHGDVGTPLLVGGHLIIAIASESNESNLALPGIYTKVSYENDVKPLQQGHRSYNPNPKRPEKKTQVCPL